ncbi:M14 family metallocarboxypeptidase [Candidatus Woesearchaeota archaeon]|nr:M14 family metallocarboxypeptidase [Candidatus Woesearchaeota archaeon]
MNKEVRNYQEIISQVEELKSSFLVRVIGEVHYDSQHLPLYRLVSEGQGGEAVLLSGGMHGDEPAGVYGVLKFLKEHASSYMNDFKFFAYPCVNPWGFTANTGSNHLGLNINRHFVFGSKVKEVESILDSLSEGPQTYLFTLDMHETPLEGEFADANKDEALPTEFYMWENCPDKERRVGDKMIASLEQRGIPVCKWESIYKDVNSGGVIYYPEGFFNQKEYGTGTTFEAFLQVNYTPQAFTTETIDNVSLEERVEQQIIVLRAALDAKKETLGF